MFFAGMGAVCSSEEGRRRRGRMMVKIKKGY